MKMEVNNWDFYELQKPILNMSTEESDALFKYYEKLEASAGVELDYDPVLLFNVTKFSSAEEIKEYYHIKNEEEFITSLRRRSNCEVIVVEKYNATISYLIVVEN